MSEIPAPTVTVFLDLPFNGSTFFTLNDATKGALDNTTYTLAGDLGTTEISADSYDISIRRGRGNFLDQTDVGTATVAFRNFARDWDQLNTSSPFAGTLGIGKQVTIDIYGQRIYTGYTDDWLNTYTFDGDAYGEFPCIDGLGVIARQQFNAWTTTASQTAGPRMTSILNRAEVGWPGGAREIDTGVTVLQGDNVTWGSNPFNYMQLVAQTDQGNVFVDRTGVLVYRDRLALVNPNPLLTFADDGTGIPFADASISGAGERFYSQVSIDRVGGTTQTASDDAVGQASSIRRLSISELLMTTDAAALALAEWLLSLYKDPIPRVKTMTVNFAALTDDLQRAQVASLDLNDVIHVTWTPLGLGSTIDEDYSIEQLEHDIPFGGPHTATFTLAPISQSSVFVLDDPTLGKLNGAGRLAF